MTLEEIAQQIKDGDRDGEYKDTTPFTRQFGFHDFLFGPKSYRLSFRLDGQIEEERNLALLLKEEAEGGRWNFHGKEWICEFYSIRDKFGPLFPNVFYYDFAFVGI